MPAPESASGRVTVFGPDPLLSVTIERDGAGHDEVHVHPAGQGVWVAAMVAELGAAPTLCALLGGETGAVLRPLLTARCRLREVPTAGTSGSYVVDDRTGSRRTVARVPRPAPHRHEIDDLVAATVAEALGSAVLVVANPYPAEGMPLSVYDRVLADVAEAGVRVVVDLSSPRLERTLARRPHIVKLNDWELAEYVRAPVDGLCGLQAAQRLVEAGARTVVVTRAGAPALVVPEQGEVYEVVPPAFAAGFREGTGDTMTGAIAAALARGLTDREAIVLGAAAGAGNFLRHGLGTGRRAVVEALAARVATRPAPRAAAQYGGVSS